MLESLQQTNIGRLNLEEPRKDIVSFDPSVEITDTDWNWIESDLRRIAPKPDLTEFLWIGSAMRVLNPERASKFKEFDEVWHRVMDYELFADRGYIKKDSYQFTTGHIKMLYPDEFAAASWTNSLAIPARIYIRNNGGQTNLLMPGLGGGLRDRKVAGLLKIAFPDEIDIRERQVLEILERFKEFNTGSRLILAEAGYVRLLGPKDYKMNLKNNVWQDMRNILDQVRGVDAASFLEDALTMSILAATEVDISNGLKLTIPKQKDPSFSEPVPALPEVRKF